MLEIYEMSLQNCSIEWFNKWCVDMQISGWEIVVNDGKFYMQRRITI